MAFSEVRFPDNISRGARGSTLTEASAMSASVPREPAMRRDTS